MAGAGRAREKAGRKGARGRGWEGRDWGLGRPALRFVAISWLPLFQKASLPGPSISHYCPVPRRADLSLSPHLRAMPVSFPPLKGVECLLGASHFLSLHLFKPYNTEVAIFASIFQIRKTQGR